MTFPTRQMARSARRAQFRVVSEPRRAPDLGSEGQSPSGQNTSIQAKADNTGSEVVGSSECKETAFIEFYRETFARLGELVEECDTNGEDEFFHAMKFMQLLGLGSEDVVHTLNYRQENICRWMNGQRRPHAAMRPYVLAQCMNILRSKVKPSPPEAFRRPIEREASGRKSQI